jgi:hypothetical protein
MIVSGIAASGLAAASGSGKKHVDWSKLSPKDRKLLEVPTEEELKRAEESHPIYEKKQPEELPPYPPAHVPSQPQQVQSPYSKN